MRILVTGITGFVGSHLAEFALAQGAEVIGSLRWRSKTEHIEHLRDRLTRLANLPEPLVVRRLLPGRVSAVRDDERLCTEARVRWRAVRGGTYPPWCAIFAARPLLALALPAPLRRALRRALRDERIAVDL